MKILTQKSGRNKCYFEIHEDGVFVKNSFIKELHEYKVHFADIYDDETLFRKKKDWVLLLISISVVFNSILITIVINQSYNSSSSGMIVFGIAMIPSLVVTGLCNNEFRAESTKSLAAAKPLNFSYSKKEMEEVDAFIAEIRKNKKDYYLKEYYRIDNLIPIQTQIARIHWLYESKYITESDARFILEELETQRIIRGI